MRPHRAINLRVTNLRWMSVSWMVKRQSCLGRVTVMVAASYFDDGFMLLQSLEDRGRSTMSRSPR